MIFAQYGRMELETLELAVHGERHDDVEEEMKISRSRHFGQTTTKRSPWRSEKEDELTVHCSNGQNAERSEEGEDGMARP